MLKHSDIQAIFRWQVHLTLLASWTTDSNLADAKLRSLHDSALRLPGREVKPDARRNFGLAPRLVSGPPMNLAAIVKGSVSLRLVDFL